MPSKLTFDVAVRVYMESMEENYVERTGSTDRHIKLERDSGRKYLRINMISTGGQKSSHSFIVIKDCVVNGERGAMKLRKGDILKCATFHQPALNFIRGNVMDLNYGKCSWTGAA